MLRTKFRELINKIPGKEGFWKKSSLDTFDNIGGYLVENGFTHEEVIKLLNNLYYAVAACYGD
jgi:hypothetical protein